MQTEAFEALKGRKIKPIEQTRVEVPHVGTLVYYPWEYKEDGQRICSLTSLTLEELKQSLPESLRLPTLMESHLVIAYTSQFEWVEINVKGYGHPLAFWAQITGSSEKPDYRCLFFKTKEYGNVELVPIAQRKLHVDTLLKDLTKATKEDFKRALREQNLDPGRYEFEHGVMATVVERGKEVGRTYVTDDIEVLVLHEQYGTPLAGKRKYTGEKLDLAKSGFPKEYHGLERYFSNPSMPSLSRLVEDHSGRCGVVVEIENCYGGLAIHPPSRINGDIVPDTHPKFCPHQRGFYVIEQQK